MASELVLERAPSYGWGSRLETMGREALKFARRQPIGAISAVFLVFIIIVALAAPVFATHDPIATATQVKLHAPSFSQNAKYWFGTDELGRDVYSRVVYGARISLEVGYGGMALTVVLSVIIALISGYFGGWLDLVIQRFVDASIAVPSLLLILAVVSILNPTVINLLMILGFIFGVRQSRIARSAVLSVKNMPYVEAARSMGAGPMRIMIRHILVNVAHVVIVIGSLTVGQLIIVEASVAFLGFGVPPPTPTWGQMLSGTARTYMTRAPWMGLAPGIAISLTVLAFNMFGDALRDVLDPKLRKAA
jgi:peptide/nickel transport system permease protein